MKYKSIEDVCKENTGLVYSEVAKVGRFDMLDDLAQEGFLGLIKAWETFDESRGTKFSTFAVPTIRGFILRSLKDYDDKVMVRIPSYLYYLGKAKENMVLVNSSDEKMYNSGNSTRSENTLINTSLTSGNPFELIEERIVMNNAMHVLKEREKKILYLRYYEDYSLQEIGDVFGLTKERVRQVLLIIENKLKKECLTKKR